MSSTSRNLRSELAPAYNAYLKAHPVDTDSPRTEDRFQRLLEDAVDNRVSDIHLDPGSDHYRIRFRHDGALHDVGELPIPAGERMIRFLETRAEIEVSKPGEPHEGRASFDVAGSDWELRFSTVPAAFGEKATLRLLGEDQIQHGIHHLGLADESLKTLEDWMAESSGMLLVAGPTGSGKTTTLYALIHQLKKRDRAIITIEHPIEYPIEGITQIEVNEHAAFSFAEGLKTILRLDPDYLLLGEIRDPESAITAVDAAGTGRILLSSIHSRDAVGAITTLRNYGVGNNEIASALDIVVAQRLVRKLCEKCRQPSAPDDSERIWLQRHGLNVPTRTWEAIGCDDCAQTGYKGRIGIFELWHLDMQFREKIAAAHSEIQLRKALEKSGHQPLSIDGLKKAAVGLTTLSELRPTGTMR